MIAKLSAHLDVDFDFVNNERLKASGFAIEGKTVNGFVNENGITINTQSPKYLNSVIGHEITHVLKGSELFDSLQSTLFDYAKSRGEYDTRLNTLTETYKGIENVDINEELTADLVGDYIFTDRRFVEHLLNTNRNAFRKIYDELKYLCKIATTGSKEEKAFLKAKKIFDDVYSKGKTNNVEGVKYAVSNWSEQKNQTQAEITINYQRTVDNVLRGNYSGDSSVIMGYTPSIYQEMGMPSLPFVIGTGHIYSTAKTKSEAIQENKYNKKNNYHGLGKQTVKNLYEAVKDPVMIISSKDVKPNAKPLRSTHSIVSIVDVGTNGKHLLLPIEITATRTVNGNKMDVNVLSSAYEKNVSELIKEAVALENTGDVGFYYIKNGDTTIVDSGVQFPVHLNDRISPNGIIRSFSEKVNMNLSDVTQSQQFKRWFGDWQNRPQKASKVVNEDGTPLIMYHGTNSDTFTVFDSTRSDKKVKLNTLGDGYYFTKSKERASRYGENIMETYLDIKKPYRVYPRDGGIKAQIEEDFGISADSLHRNDIQNVLKSKGYDGILLHYSKYHDTDWETAVVFEPTQIKSATDNVGTYDKNNPNINYSLSPTTPETSPGGTLKITSDDVTLKANPKSNESVKDTEDITFEEALPFADEPTLTELPAERDGKFSNAEKSYVSMEDFANNESAVWRNVDYNDSKTKLNIMHETHNSMVKEGKVVTVSDDVRANVTESFPDLRGMKKKERTAILREAMTNLKNNLRQFLGGLKNQTFEFEIDGKVLEAKLYSTGINEVLEKVTENKANMLYTTEEIFKNAQYLYSTTDYDSDPNVYRWNYFYTPVQIGDEIVGVRIAVRDLATPQGSQIYNWGIKKDATLDGVGRGIHNRISNGVSSDASSETSLDGVGGGTNNRISNDVSSDVSDNSIPISSQNVNTPKRPTREELHNNIIERIKARFSKRGFDFDEILRKAKDLSTFATVDNTPQRVMEKSLGYMEGQILADETVNKVAQNETEGIKWLNNYIAEIKKISKEYGIKPNSKESSAAQMYAEGFYVRKNGDIIEYGDNELELDFPDEKVRENIKRLANNPRIRQIYDDTLTQINESRARNGYPEIPRLDNYFLHFRAMDDTFSRLGLPFNPNDIRAKDLPTDLNGVTADLKPGQPYFASSMHREGKRTSFDLLGGLERYLSSAKNQIFHIDDIQTLRALRNYIADTYGQAKGLESLDALPEEEAQEKIKQVYDSHLSTFAKFLNEEANILAGKTSLIDRGIEGIIGRRGIAFLDSVNKQVGSNTVL